MRQIGRVPTGPLRQRISVNAETYTLYEDVSDSSYGGQEYEDSGREADIWLFSPQNMTEIVMSGEQRGGDLQGLCLPDEVIQHNDRVSYGQGEYEIDTITPMPSDTDVILYELTLSKSIEGALQP